MDEDFDSSTAAAWTRFQARLADHLLEMEEDDLLLLQAESSLDDEDGAAPYVQLCAWGPGQLRCEAVSNEFLAGTHQLDEAGALALVQLGFEAPSCASDEEPDAGSANFWLDVEDDEADRVAVMAVRALRDVYRVAHPAFVSGLPTEEDDVHAAGAAEVGGAADHPSGEVAGEEPVVYPADGPQHLQRLVDEVLTPGIGHAPVHDDDGDIPIECGEVVVFVRVLGDKPVIRLFACLASGITDRRRATFEVAVLNRDQLFFKFLLIGDAVVMQTDILAWPFAPAHLRDLVEQMCRSVGQIHDDLEVRLGAPWEGWHDVDGDRVEDGDGVEDGDAVEDDPALHPAMHTLLELDADEPGWVDPMLAAAICEHDRDLVLALLTWTERELGELRQGERLTGLLRAALRITVEREARSLQLRD